MGQSNISQFCPVIKTTIINQIKRYRVREMSSPFQRRITSIAWHPIYSHIAVAGSKGGELLLKDLSCSNTGFCPGIGAGGSIVGLKFSAHDPCIVYTVSITGNIRQEDFNGKASKNFLATGSCENWFSSLDVCYDKGLILSGDCRGNGYLISTAGVKVWPKSRKFHCGKVTHIEFHPKNPNIFVTASSNDHFVKLWDMRMLKDSGQTLLPTDKFHHVRGVNSAYFSPSNGCSLLTTDQHSELRIYSAPNWQNVISIPHPHRQFQHMTPIKATWHSLEDIVVVGRYPDDNFQSSDVRTIDFYDGSTGDMLHRENSPSGTIVSLNAFNISGDCLASGAAYNLVFWQDGYLMDDLYSNNDLECKTVVKSAKIRTQKVQRSSTKAKKRVLTEKKVMTVKKNKKL